MPNGVTPAKHVSSAMESALQYLGVRADEIEELCSSLRQIIEIAEGWYARACQPDQPIDSDSFSLPAARIPQQPLPKSLQRNLKVISADETGQLRVEALHQNRDRLANELSKDLALLRHATDFVEDVARCTTSNEAESSPGDLLELFPACGTENDQAFWQSHQDQVCHAHRLLQLTNHVC